MTTTWSDLVAGNQYRVYVFGLENAAGNYIHDITLAGSNTVNFTQTLTNGELYVNDAIGSSSNQLDTYADLVTADGNGEIVVTVAPVRDRPASPWPHLHCSRLAATRPTP